MSTSLLLMGVARNEDLDACDFQMPAFFRCADCPKDFPWAQMDCRFGDSLCPTCASKRANYDYRLPCDGEIRQGNETVTCGRPLTGDEWTWVGTHVLCPDCVADPARLPRERANALDPFVEEVA